MSSQKIFSHVFFDLDGTLTDSAPGIIRSIQYACEKMKIESPCQQLLRSCVGPPLQESFKKIFSSDEQVQAGIGYYRERYATTGIFENEVYDGIPQLLTELKSENIKLFVATAKPTVYALRILEHFKLLDFFERCYGSELDGRFTRKDELLNFLLKTENINYDNCVMIGDRSFDIAAAQKNKLVALGVLYGYGSLEELESAGALWTIKRVGEIKSKLEEIYKSHNARL